MPERLQKILAQAGYGSRRACEDFITAGRVRVNGQIASLGQKADLALDKITVDGKPIAVAESPRRPDQQQLDSWRRGVVLEDGYKTAPVDIRFESAQGKGAWVRVIMGEGRKRQIRETCKQLGLPIVRILRVRIGPLKLGNLKPRQWRYLTMQEVADLKGGETNRKPNRR